MEMTGTDKDSWRNNLRWYSFSRDFISALYIGPMGRPKKKKRSITFDMALSEKIDYSMKRFLL
jgi:hypothetical protein